MAVKAAKEKAEALTKDLGQKLGKPYSINENFSNWYSGYRRWGNMMSQNVLQNIGSSYQSGESSVALGQIKISANITVSFEFE